MKKLLAIGVLILFSAGSTYAQTTDFFELAKTGTPKSIEAAIRQGADPRARDKYGETALMYAAGNNQNPEVSLVLLRAGADINAKSTDGWTPLMLRCRK